VRLLQAPNTRMGTLVSDADAKGRFRFEQDPRLEDKFPTSDVFDDEIELCTRPSDAQVRAINAAIKRG
jgi:hypothetical protein